ncbi:MAG: phosphopantetheine-binding protein [Hydrogenophilus sp.]|nr:phosphopantetheine-binding protein [Hydrogenophilus sp.]
MNDINTEMLCSEVIAVLTEVLALPSERASALQADSPLLGAVPELDSMTALALLEGLERRFSISIADEEFNSAIFTTVASLTAFVADHLRR